MAQTLDQIRRDGLEALRKKLGVAGMIRFLQQFEKGDGDYTVERRRWVDRTALEEINRLARTRHRRPKSR